MFPMAVLAVIGSFGEKTLFQSFVLVGAVVDRNFVAVGSDVVVVHSYLYVYAVVVEKLGKQSSLALLLHCCCNPHQLFRAWIEGICYQEQYEW